MVRLSVLTDGPRFVLFEDQAGETGMAAYRLGKWRGIDRWRGYTLQKRRSRQPYLEAPGGKVRVPVTIMTEVE